MNRSNLVMAMKCLVGILALIAFLSPPLSAQQDELPRLWKKIAELEHRMERLEGLLKVYNDAAKEPMNSEFGWQNKKNWRMLKIGMTEAQVKTFLGEPTKIIKGVRKLWYYPNIYCGYVSFGKDGQLTGWSEP